MRPSGARYQLVMGERRWRAAQTAGLTAIPAIVRETADDNLLRDALLENIHRAQLNPLEEAAAYQQLLDEFDVTHEELAARIGRSRPLITNMIRLLRLPIAVQRRVAAGVLSAGHARALLSLEAGAEAQEALAARIVAEGLSVRATEEAVTLANRERAESAGGAATQADSHARPPGCGRAALQRVRHPGHGEPRQAQRQDRGRVRLGGRFATHCRIDERVKELTVHTDSLRHCDNPPDQAALICPDFPNPAVHQTISILARDQACTRRSVGPKPPAGRRGGSRKRPRAGIAAGPVLGVRSAAGWGYYPLAGKPGHH